MTRPEPAPLGKWPLCWPAIAGVGGLFCARGACWLLLSFAVAALFSGGIYWRRPVLVMAALVALILATRHSQALTTQQNLAERLATGHELTLSGTLTESNRSGLVRRAFRTDSGARLSLLNLPDRFETGQRIDLIATPIPQRERRNPGGIDFSQIILNRGFAGSVEVTEVQQNGWARGFPLMRGWSEDMRNKLALRVSQGIRDPTDAQLVQAVVLGEKADSGRLLEDFRKTGTMHVFAVSGLHVGLVAIIAGALARTLRLSPRVAIWIVILAMFCYALITGLRPPALRAALMGSLLLGRFLLNRKTSVVNNLFAAAIVVLFLDTFQFWQIGFQLSFFVVAIILLIEPHLWRRVEPLSLQDAFLPKPLWNRWQRFSTKFRREFLRMFTVSGAAWFGSAPLSVLYFGWFTPIAVLASVLMVLMAFLILNLAFLSLAVGSVLPSVGETMNLVNSQFARFSRYSAAQMSSWPGAWTRVQRPAPWQDGLCVFDIPFGGAAIHLDAGGGVLLDGASDFDYWLTIKPALEAAGLSCDSQIATHADAIHIGGLRSALVDFPIRQILIPEKDSTASLGSLITEATEASIPLIPAQVGQRLPIEPDVFIEVLAGGDSDHGRADDRGLVIRIHHHGWRILYTADAGYLTEKALLASGCDLASDLWICGRNGGDLTGTDAFVDAVAPQAIIATDRRYPASEQVPSSWRKWLESEGILFLSQRDHGAIFVIPKRNELRLEGFLSEQVYRLKR